MNRALLLLYAVAVFALVGFALRESGAMTAGAMRLGPPPEVRESAEPIEFTVESGMLPDAVRDGLVAAGVLTDPRRFDLLVGLNGVGSELKAGCYLFTSGTPASDVVHRLRGGLTSAQLLAIPEGRRIEEVGALLVSERVATQQQWNQALASAPRDRLPVSLPAGRSLLGYLLPASYPLQCDVSPQEMVAAMIDAFAREVTSDLISAIRARGLSLDEGITLASIVEREAVLKSEQPIIASVFLNRLEDGIPLQADPTVQFALASARPPAAGGTWWKRDLTETDLRFDSPYNTYVVAGLPPGPIANPGIDAIKAVANAARTDYIYFVAKGDGSHAFARTLAEHNANVAQYQLRR